MRAFLPISILLLSGCSGVGGVTANWTQPDSAQSTGQSSGGGSSSAGGSSTSSSAPPSGAPVNPAGIWDITDTVNGKPVTEVALIADAKYFALATSDAFGCGDVTGGSYTIDSSVFTGSGVTALLSNNCLPPDGHNYVPWTLSGYMLNADLNLSFDVDGMLVPTLGATMDPLYNLYTSSIATLVGNWDDAGNVLTVNPDGTFFEQQGNGCTITGAYTIIDPAHNLYSVSFMFDAATCSTNSIAGIQFTGLAYLTPNSSSGWYHLLEDASGVSVSGALVVVFDSITPFFTPPTG